MVTKAKAAPAPATLKAKKEETMDTSATTVAHPAATPAKRADRSGIAANADSTSPSRQKWEDYFKNMMKIYYNHDQVLLSHQLCEDFIIHGISVQKKKKIQIVPLLTKTKLKLEFSLFWDVLLIGWVASFLC